MKLVGGAYHNYLGFQQWRSTYPTSAATLVNALKAPLKVIFWSNVLTNSLSPKVALLVLAFVPQFVQSGSDASSQLVQMLLLGAIFSVLAVIAYGALGAAAGSVSR